MKFFICVCIICISCKSDKNTISGSWMMEEINYIYPDTTYKVSPANVGTFIFADYRYIIMYNPWRTERTPFKTLSKPTQNEMIHAFKTLVFNTGKYVFTDSTITTTADIAKVPGFEGGKQYYRYTIEDDVLYITMYDETYPNGDKPEWYGKLQINFVLKKEN